MLVLDPRINVMGVIAMTLAEATARVRSERIIGVEHIALGLLQQLSTTACLAMRHIDYNIEETLEALQNRMPTPNPQEGAFKLSSRARIVMQYAFDEARQTSDLYVGTEHLLLAVVRERDSFAAHVLKECGFNLEELRKAFRELRAQGITGQ